MNLLGLLPEVADLAARLQAALRRDDDSLVAVKVICESVGVGRDHRVKVTVVNRRLAVFDALDFGLQDVADPLPRGRLDGVKLKIEAVQADRADRGLQLASG